MRSRNDRGHEADVGEIAQRGILPGQREAAERRGESGYREHGPQRPHAVGGALQVREVLGDRRRAARRWRRRRTGRSGRSAAATSPCRPPDSRSRNPRRSASLFSISRSSTPQKWPISPRRSRAMNCRCSSDVASKARSHSVSAPIERLLRLAEPMRSRQSSTIITLLCTMTAAAELASRVAG